MRAMNTTAIIPASLHALWNEARNWVAFILGGIDRTEMRETGIRRERGARLSIWLLNVECAIRRLILTAALALTPPQQRQRASRQRLTPHKPRPPAFRIFRLHAETTTPSRRHARSVSTRAPYAHIRFPADPLLALGAPHARAAHRTHNGGPPLAQPRKPNPLDRQGRLSRQDPDWRAPEESASRQPRRDSPRSRQQRRARLPHDPDAFPPSLHDWRRVHDEWQRLIPAPGLAARLDALERITANPAAAILRTARRLAHSRNRALALARTAAPPTRTPRRVRHVQTAGHSERFARNSHAAFIAHDTS